LTGYFGMNFTNMWELGLAAQAEGAKGVGMDPNTSPIPGVVGVQVVSLRLSPRARILCIERTSCSPTPLPQYRQKQFWLFFAILAAIVFILFERMQFFTNLF
jgi:hypothetical protein